MTGILGKPKVKVLKCQDLVPAYDMIPYCVLVWTLGNHPALRGRSCPNSMSKGV